MAIIELEGIHKEYAFGDTVTHALRGIDMKLKKGEFVALWGPSGSGKSTLLNIIGILDEPTSGNISFHGRAMENIGDDDRSELRNEAIGFVFQNFNLLPVLSALENVMLPLEIQGASGHDAREMATEKLLSVGLEDFLDQRPDKLSGGQQQRVAIARALAVNPALVIADEPTANLDSENARNIISLMRRLNEEDGTTFLFATHDKRLLDQVNRLVKIEDGKIVEDGGVS